MSIYDALVQYQKCCECPYYDDCPDREAKLKAIFNQPVISMPKPTNPLNPFTPYKSKYFDDHRFDPPRELTYQDIICAMERLKNK